MPLFTVSTILGYWPLGRHICDTWLALDYLASNASVLNLLIISFDRYFSVTRPLTYRAKRTTSKAAIMIGKFYFPLSRDRFSTELQLEISPEWSIEIIFSPVRGLKLWHFLKRVLKRCEYGLGFDFLRTRALEEPHVLRGGPASTIKRDEQTYRCQSAILDPLSRVFIGRSHRLRFHFSALEAISALFARYVKAL